MAEQKLVATGECRLGTGDMFEMAEKAKNARHICQQAEKEIQKTFPDFKFGFTTAPWYDPAKPRPGRRAAGAATTAGDPAAGAANGADTGAGATA